MDVWQGCIFSDHFMVPFNINTAKSMQDPKQLLSEKSKTSTQQSLHLTLLETWWNVISSQCLLDECIGKYNWVLKIILDKHTPERNKNLKLEAQFPGSLMT